MLRCSKDLSELLRSSGASCVAARSFRSFSGTPDLFALQQKQAPEKLGACWPSNKLRSSLELGALELSRRSELWSSGALSKFSWSSLEARSSSFEALSELGACWPSSKLRSSPELGACWPSSKLWSSLGALKLSPRSELSRSSLGARSLLAEQQAPKLSGAQSLLPEQQAQELSKACCVAARSFRSSREAPELVCLFKQKKHKKKTKKSKHLT